MIGCLRRIRQGGAKHFLILKVYMTCKQTTCVNDSIVKYAQIEPIFTILKSTRRIIRHIWINIIDSINIWHLEIGNNTYAISLAC